jgi:S1-C subfamily serine protease
MDDQMTQFSPPEESTPAWDPAAPSAAVASDRPMNAPPSEARIANGGGAPAPRATRRRAVAGMAALAIAAAAFASGGTTLALVASGALVRPNVTVVSANAPAEVVSYVTPASSGASGTDGSSNTAAAQASDSVVSAAARVSPAVVTIITSGAADSTGSGQIQNPFGQGNGNGSGGGTQGGSGSNGSGTLPGSGTQGQSLYGLPSGQTPVSVGSGVIFNSNGWILTNHHVVSDPGTLTVQLSDGRSFPATVYGTDTLTDLAIVKIDATGLSTATLGDSSALQLGQTVLAVGDPLGTYPGTVTVGVVSGVDRSITDTTGSLDDLIQTDAAINPGNSGGPLVATNGAVIGIDTAVAGSAQGIGFAIPINVAIPLTQQALAGQQLARPWIGIQYQSLDAGLAARNNLSVSEGAWITSDGTGSAVQAGSPAATAGLRENDVITAVDGSKVDTNHPLVELLATHQPGSTVTLTVRRGTTDLTVQVTLATRPATTN